MNKLRLFSRSALFLSFTWVACSDGGLATLSENACTAGGGQVAAGACPNESEAIAAGVDGGKKCCFPGGSVTFAQCMALGGRAHTDPGNGSLKACPSGAALISSRLSGAIEGGLCCQP